MLLARGMTIRRGLAIIGLGAALALGNAGVVGATHDHDLITPGTTVTDVAQGATSKTNAAYHKFHSKVHKGSPEDAMGNPKNPVCIVVSGTSSTCP